MQTIAKMNWGVPIKVNSL